MSKGYAIYLGRDNRKLKVLEFIIQQYPKSQQLMQFMKEHQNSTVTCADLKAAGFEDITKDLMYPTRPMGKSGCGPLAGDAQIVLNDSGTIRLQRRLKKKGLLVLNIMSNGIKVQWSGLRNASSISISW